MLSSATLYIYITKEHTRKRKKVSLLESVHVQAQTVSVFESKERACAIASCNGPQSATGHALCHELALHEVQVRVLLENLGDNSVNVDKIDIQQLDEVHNVNTA